MHVAPPSLVDELKALQHFPDARQAERVKPRNSLANAIQPPATAQQAKVLRTLVHRFRQVSEC